MLNTFFSPKSVAVIGASRNPGKIGHNILKNLIEAGFKGKIYPVNPNADKILEYKCYNSISSLPKNIDLAIIAIPAKFVLASVRECGEKQIQNLIIISAGFRESGSNGLKLEKELIELARKFDIKILGPNCLGLINPHNNINASFAKTMVDKGHIAFISQSGAICSAMLDWAKKEYISFSKFVSLGNMAILNELDFLEYFITDTDTKAVFAYLENFSEGKRFIEITKKLSSQKPLIILKSGITEKGKSIAMSHTGAMAEDKNIIKGILSQVNAIQCSSLSQMFNLIKLISNSNVPQDRNIAVVANAGGVNVVTADLISESSLNLMNFEKNIVRKLHDNLPPIIQINNPLDIIGDAGANRYSIAIENILKDKNISNLLVTLTPQTITEPLDTAKVVVNLSKKFKKNIITNFIGGGEIQESVEYLSKNKIANFSYPENAINALEKLIVWKNNTKKKNKAISKKGVDFAIAKNKAEEIEKILKGNTGMLDYSKAKNIMEILSLPIIKGMLSSELKELNLFAQKNGYPVVMKVISNSIIHKTEAGAIKLGINSPQEMSKSYEQLIKLTEKFKPKLLVQPMISNGIEIIIGAKREVKFGSVILFGLGGIYTEIFKDISLRVAPITADDALEMISEIKISKIFEGARGQKIDKDELVKIMLKISYLLENFPEIKEIDLNPVILKDNNVYLVDVRIIT